MSKIQWRLLFLAVLLALGVAGALTLVAVNPKNRNQVPTQATRPLPTQSIRFTIYPEGIYPQTARAHQGPVSIQVEDLTGGNSTMVVERLTGSGRVEAGRVRRFGRHFRGRSILELVPGQYRLRIAERSAAEAELIVVP